MKKESWQQMMWQVLFPMLDRVKVLATSASTAKIESNTVTGSNILIHHSRDTESKQWAETSVQTLSTVARIFIAQRSLLLSLCTERSALWAKSGSNAFSYVFSRFSAGVVFAADLY